MTSNHDNLSFPMKVVASFKETNVLQGAAKFKDETDQVFILNSADESVEIPFTLMAGCDQINTSQNSCRDFVNVRVFANGKNESFAKKRFYIETKTAP